MGPICQDLDAGTRILGPGCWENRVSFSQKGHISFVARLEVRFCRKKLFLAFTLTGGVKWPVNERFRSTGRTLLSHFLIWVLFNIYIYRYRIRLGPQKEPTLVSH